MLVAHHDDREDRDDGERDRQGERGHRAEAGEEEHPHDLLGRIRGGRDVVRRKDGEPLGLTDPFLKLVRGRDALPEQDAAYDVGQPAGPRRGREDLFGRNEVSRVLALELALERSNDPHVAVAVAATSHGMPLLEVGARGLLRAVGIWLAHP